MVRTNNNKINTELNQSQSKSVLADGRVLDLSDIPFLLLPSTRNKRALTIHGDHAGSMHCFVADSLECIHPSRQTCVHYRCPVSPPNVQLLGLLTSLFPTGMSLSVVRGFFQKRLPNFSSSISTWLKRVCWCWETTYNTIINEAEPECMVHTRCSCNTI